MRLDSGGQDLLEQIGGRFEPMSQIILIEKHLVSLVQQVRQPGGIQDSLEESYWPDNVIYLRSILVDDQTVVCHQPMHPALVSKEHQDLAKIVQPGFIL